MTTPKLNRIRVAGFRSLRDVSLELTPVTVLIGPNGAGKSNLLWALEMVRMLAFESLQLFVGERGGATYLLHYGPQQTAAIDLELELTSDGGENAYAARLGYGANESLIFLTEKTGFRSGPEDAWRWSEMGAGHQESKLGSCAESDKTAKTVQWLLRQINFYHFHDTSRRSPLRTRDFADTSGDQLRSDGSNLATFLEGLRSSEVSADKAAWRRIEGSIRRVAPFISALTPKRDRLGTGLEWVDDRGVSFGPAHLSDGTLRALALIAALGQPEGGMPIVSCIDEPELGLHPAALEILCGLISSVSTRRQVIVSTQSPVVLDHFEPEQVVVAERHDSATHLKRLSSERLASWLEDYALSEVYEKNVIGGRP
ncbi:MAG: AAA family ATPase [Candidatus Schekmanbacteria bacterium]|nr:AAA family ATPase [Candidatus Schekmanbacteria bacterium]